MLRAAVESPNEAAVAILGDLNPHVLRADDCSVLSFVRLPILEHQLNEIPRLRIATLFLRRERGRQSSRRITRLNDSQLIAIFCELSVGILRAHLLWLT